jgi:hypothetical protein
MSYIITVVISTIFGFILCSILVAGDDSIQVETHLITKVRDEAYRCGNGMIQYGMIKTLKMLKLEEDDENNL